MLNRHLICDAIYSKIHSSTLLFLQFCRLGINRRSFLFRFTRRRKDRATTIVVADDVFIVATIESVVQDRTTEDAIVNSRERNDEIHDVAGGGTTIDQDIDV